jgi:DNA-binding NarL/FixJ family response regulator
MSKLRILVADDHPVIRKALECLVDAEPDMEVVGEAGDGSEACRQAAVLQPDLILMDLWMPNMSGEEATKHIKRAHPGIKILALTAQEDPSYACDLLEAGATGYVFKRAASFELVNAIHTVARGGVYIDPRIESAVIDALSRRHGRKTGENDELSERESEVLRGIALGYTNKEVAARLELSVKTVETYKGRSMKKLRLRNRIDLIRLATKRGWITLSNASGK